MPAAYITPTWSRPLYQGLIPATYCSRNRRCRSVIMESPLALDSIADILDVYQVAVKESREPPRRRGGDRPGATSLTDRAYADIEEMIVFLKLAPGSAISEAELSQPPRHRPHADQEALQRLARERLVTILPRRGIIVSPIDVAAQLRLLEVRRELERLIARSAARRRHRGRALALSPARRRLREGRQGRRRRRLHAHRPRLQHPLLGRVAQRVRGQRDEPDARAVAPLLVRALPAGRQHAADRQAACRHRPRHRRP